MSDDRNDNDNGPLGAAVRAQIVANGGKLMHCDKPMIDDGECSSGCCDYYKCQVCGKRLVCEYGD